MAKKKKEVQLPKELQWYHKHFKKLMIIPILLLVLSLVSITLTTLEEGTPIKRDISLKGGLSAIIEVEELKSIDVVKEDFSQAFSENSFVFSELTYEGKQTGYIIDTDLPEEEFKEYITQYFGEEFIEGENYNGNFISESLSNSFFKQALIVLAVSFLLMSAVIFFYFRETVPAMAVILSAAFDVVVTVGLLNLLDVEISIAGVGALLMLIGYSIDTDVLLTNRLVKEFGFNYLEKAYDAFKTGVLMSATTLTAGVVALLLTNSEVIAEIAIILIVGLLVDFVSTWIQNSGMLLWWLEKKEGKLK